MEFDRALPLERIVVRAPDLWTYIETVEGYGPFEIVLPSSALTLHVPEGAMSRAWLHGRPMHPDPRERTLRLRGIPADSHRLLLALPDGHRFARAVHIASGEELAIYAPPPRPW